MCSSFLNQLFEMTSALTSEVLVSMIHVGRGSLLRFAMGEATDGESRKPM